jgi:CheY-like chemotaxis protein
MQLTNEDRAALVEEYGSRSMLRLARAKELAPAGGQFADACMAAAAALANDPQRIATLVAELNDPSPEVRVAARNDLAATGELGVAATLEALAREPEPERRDAIAAAAAQMDPLTVGPLLAMLSTNDPALRTEVASILEHLAPPQAIPFLPKDRATAERVLVDAIDRYSSGTPPFAVDENNQVELWHWNDTTKRLTAARYAADDARIIWTARLARALAQLRPTNSHYQRQAWLLGLEAAGLVGTTQNLLSRVDVNLVNEVLADALEGNYPNAAIATASELGRRQNDSVLYTADGRSSPLARAVRHRDRRVRFAAVAAIMAIDPKSPYPGSSYVPKALAWFATAGGDRHALVAMPTNLAASDLAGMLAAHGLDAEATNRGRDAVNAARQTADLEMIFVDMDILLPGVRQVLYELRVLPRTSKVPIALLAADGRLEAARALANEHDRVVAVSRPHSKEVVANIVERLSQVAGHPAIPPERRAAEALQALDWLAQLAASEQSIYELDRAAPIFEAALYREETANTAIPALTRIGSASSQRSLLHLASQSTVPIAIRSQAADAFQSSVSAHGVLLTSSEILAQYDLYNASEKADAETQRVLGSLLDAIESRRDSQRPVSIPPP